ncbi:arginine N-succinyltransferase [Parvularcula sp. IMCC14364]|uniref:arginine N-succinyltransferase n=1 Tax=Parvularcula sp. IMCC14364 TaxID=3067902 RepID=UPI002741B180|nr:arginine N-succinyltransferase [Parvularcula sp. IMCC14364]
MIRVRPAQQNDLPGLMDLAAKAGLGMTTMPHNEKAMKKRIYLSQEAFARQEQPEQKETFFLVLEYDKKIIGTGSVFTRLGADRPFYSYRMSHLVNQSPELDIRLETDLLYLVNDYHDFTEIGTLFVDPAHRGGGVGRLLSFSRFMLFAANPSRFGDKVMAEIRGWTDREDSFPFWEQVASKFFGMTFIEADKRSTSDFRFIADLMPKYPIYTEMLPQEVRDILGKPHDNSKPAMDLLLSQGFRYNNLIDIFDAGPSIEADMKDVKTIQDAGRRKAVSGGAVTDGRKALVSTLGLSGFSCIQVETATPDSEEIPLTDKMMQELGITTGDDVMVCMMEGKQA